MMDAIARWDVDRVVFKTSSQVGKTEIVNNIAGYFVHLDPCPMLVVQPNIEMARAWSTDRLEPMRRDTPVLERLIRAGRTKEGRATKLQKTFPGGHLTIVGANAPAGLASRPIRIVLFDEVDRFPPSAGKEGDPVMLAEARTKTFHDSKVLMVSTPTTSDLSRIEIAFDETDQRYYHVPCPHCGAEQRLQWAQVRFEGSDAEESPPTTFYECEASGCVIEEHSKREMLARGRWIADKPGRSTPGFHLSALYSPWESWASVVREFLKAKDDPARLQVWTNTMLGETWDDGERIEAGELQERAEAYDEAPSEVRYLTAGVDVQDDRLEVLVCGWGTGDEMWAIDHHLIHGRPNKEDDRCWKMLDRYLKRAFKRQDGAQLYLQAKCVDSGYLADAVYSFCYPRYSDAVFATKGRGGQDVPIVLRRDRRKKTVKKCPVFTIGTDAAKDVLFARLKKETHGPGAMHFRQAFGREFFEQVTSEVKRVIYTVGRETVRYVKTRARNEALDLLVLNLAALHIERPLLVGPVREHEPKPAQPELPLEAPEDEPPAATPGARRRQKPTGGWDLK